MKKKILGLLMCIVAVISFVGTDFAYAAPDSGLADGCKITRLSRLPNNLVIAENGGCSEDCKYDTGNCGMCCLLNSVYNITDWVFVVLMAISSLMIIWGAVLFTTSQGNTDSVTKARQLILFAAVGIAVALFSRAIPPAVKMIIGV